MGKIKKMKSEDGSQNKRLPLYFFWLLTPDFYNSEPLSAFGTELTPLGGFIPALKAEY
jgi:hypothetical protein